MRQTRKNLDGKWDIKIGEGRITYRQPSEDCWLCRCLHVANAAPAHSPPPAVGILRCVLVQCPPIILHHNGRRITYPRLEGFGGDPRLIKRAMARRVVGAGAVEYLHLAGSEDGYYVEIPRRIRVVEIEIHVRLFERETILQDGCRAGDDGLEGEGASFGVALRLRSTQPYVDEGKEERGQQTHLPQTPIDIPHHNCKVAIISLHKDRIPAKLILHTRKWIVQRAREIPSGSGLAIIPMIERSSTPPQNSTSKSRLKEDPVKDGCPVTNCPG
jgi:hypothetical protein